MRIEPFECITPLLHILAARGCAFLGEYTVTLASDTVGSVDIFEEGLYLRFRCQCTVPRDRIYKLFACCGGKYYDLGVLVPYGVGFAVDKKIPKKEFLYRDFQFLIRTNAANDSEQTEILRPEQPCQSLKHLYNAHLEIRDGQHWMIY